MKKLLYILIFLLIFSMPISRAEVFDTNIVNREISPSGSDVDGLYKFWAFYNVTGTRYVIRVYDWNSERYIAVPKEYYINHVYGYNSNGYVSSSKEVMYLGVDKTANGQYEVVRSGKGIFTDNTYTHIIKWFNNSNVNNFGLTKNDINFLAQIVKEEASKKGNNVLAKNMQNVIEGTVPFDVRAEILFLLKLPGTDGAMQLGRVTGKGSIEDYNFTFYNNKANSSTPSSMWRKEYITYLEAKAIAYNWGDDSGILLKSFWLDKIACALYERHNEYVFNNGVYQCSCDLYKRRYGTGVTYWLDDNKININQAAYDPENMGDKMYRYYTPGRCGIPINMSGRIYYVTAGQTYDNLNGNKVTIHKRTFFSDRPKGVEAHNYDYLNVVSTDATKATLYEGWDYITNNLASILVIACEKETGNIITLDNVTYSEFSSVGVGNYNKIAWEINGYEYLGYLTKNDLTAPNVPLGVVDTANNVNVTITSNDVSSGNKKQVVFVYEKAKEKVKETEVRLSIYKLQDAGNSVMFTGKYFIDKDNVLNIEIYDEDGNLVYEKNIVYDEGDFYVDTVELETALLIDKEKFKYEGNLIKVHEEYFLTYLGEVLDFNSGLIYNLKNVGENKVHVILGYSLTEEDPFDDPPPIIKEEFPKLKISYLDEKGNALPGKAPTITEEEINKEIISIAEDLRADFYMYVGYMFVDSHDEFCDIVSPLTIMGETNNVKTIFDEGNDRRHIAFIYKKIELEFEIDIIMEPNDLKNQYIGQIETEDYWVLDEKGKVYLKVFVKGAEGLDVDYAVKVKMPFDTYMNSYYIKANSVNNLVVYDLSKIMVADEFMVPIWVVEKEYVIDALIEADVKGFGKVSASKSDNVEIVGKLYDFTVTNLDGSERTGDEKWKEALFENESIEYKANSIPIGQGINQPEKYNYGIKLGTTFYFSINTKGIKNDAISIVPEFLYVSKDGNTIKDVDVYITENGKIKNILSNDLNERYMKISDADVLKSNVIEEIKKAQAISKVLDRYKYSVKENRNIGTFSNTILSRFLSLPYLNYVSEFNDLYGNNALRSAEKTENELLINASHWYGKYVVPSNAKVIEKGASQYLNGFNDGYLIVLFKIISLDSDGNEYLAYNLPKDFTMWQQENLNQVINLPIISAKDTSSKSITLNSLDDGFAPVIIYQIGVSTKDNNTSVGTH